MKNDPNLVVTVSNRNNDGVWKVFITNWQDGFIFGPTEKTGAEAVWSSSTGNASIEYARNKTKTTAWG